MLISALSINVTLISKGPLLMSILNYFGKSSTAQSSSTAGGTVANGPQPIDTPDPTQLGRLHLWVFLVAFVGSVLFLVLQYWYVEGYTFQKLTTTLMWALACLVSGVGVGFLFGIPRVNQPGRRRAAVTTDPGAAGPSQAARPVTVVAETDQRGYSQTVNANLEEISDWLTKIIVGLGLVELRNIPDHLYSMAQLLASCLGETCSLAMAHALIVWFAVLGFLIGYLATRIYLAFVFSIADELSNNALGHIKSDREKFKADVAAIGKTEEDRIKVQAGNIADKLNKSLAAVTKGLRVLEKPGRRKDEVQPEDEPSIQEAIADLTRVLADDAADAGAAVILGRLYRWKKHDLKKAIEILSRTADTMRQQNILTMGFGSVVYNRACYHVLLAERMTPAERTASLESEKVKEDLENAFTYTRSLAKDARTDPDLASLRSETWFQELVQRFDPEAPAVTATPAAPTTATATVDPAGGATATATTTTGAAEPKPEQKPPKPPPQ